MEIKLNPELQYNRGVISKDKVVLGVETADVTDAQWKKLKKIERQGLPVWVPADYNGNDSKDNDES